METAWKKNGDSKGSVTHTTRRAVKVIGTRTHIDRDTGEIMEMQVLSVEDRDCNFHKLWLEHILASIELIGNQKTRVAFWIIEHLNRENLLIASMREIARACGTGLDTVRLTMSALQEADFLHMVKRGVYRVNPDVVYKGGKSDRMNVLIQYKGTPKGKVIGIGSRR